MAKINLLQANEGVELSQIPLGRRKAGDLHGTELKMRRLNLRQQDRTSAEIDWRAALRCSMSLREIARALASTGAGERPCVSQPGVVRPAVARNQKLLVSKQARESVREQAWAYVWPRASSRARAHER
eukprot:3703663-Pleurochrysis_carterae.AAC.1